MAAMSSKSTSLKEYLKKYTTDNNEEKKKKKKTRKSKPDVAGVLVVDEDSIWQNPVKPEEEEDSADEEKPQVDEDIEVKRMKRLEQLKLRRPFGAISEDGSGWVSVSNNSRHVISEDQNSDISPLRERRARNDTPSPKPEQKLDSAKDADLSPPRQLRKHFHRASPDRKKMHFSSDRRTRYDSPSPEPNLEASDLNKAVTDLSPPRRQQVDKFTSSPEYGRKSSYPRATDSDISPPYRARHGSKHQDDSRASSALDLSPPRKVKNREMDTVDISANKSKRNLDNSTVDLATSVSDLSPPRKRRRESPIRLSKTGLVSGVDIKEEIDRKKKEDLLRFKGMDPFVSGRGAEPIYRNKITGERVSKEEFFKSQKEKQKKEEKPKEVKLEWGKGLAQKREAEARQEELQLEKNKPFARSRDDPDLDTMLKERVRWGDPMAHLVKKKHSEPVLPNLGDSENMKESGFIIPQEIPSHSWIRRKLDAAPNRYGIKPGRHWDGVDRSSGYEKELFKRMNEKRATERESYLWSVSDM